MISYLQRIAIFYNYFVKHVMHVPMFFVDEYTVALKCKTQQEKSHNMTANHRTQQQIKQHEIKSHNMTLNHKT